MKQSAIKHTLLIIDDDKLLCDVIKQYFGDTMEVYAASTGTAGLAVCSRKKIDVILLDQNLPDGEGYALCPSILKYNEQAKIIFITAYPNFENAVNAVKAGAHDYLSKPFELDELQLAIKRAFRTIELEKIEQCQHYKEEKESRETVLVGSSLAPLRRLIELAALSSAPVLITGETGTGKNVAARLVHCYGPNKLAPFVSVNCAALPADLIEAELFGYEKGAFTGAIASKMGIFEMAEGGTLLLDEIGAMPLHLQSKLLSVLEDKQFKKLGSDSIMPVAVRVIAATNAKLEDAMKSKAFREDLYYRLSVIRIDMPPLRLRRQDIPEVCNYFIKKITGREIRLSDHEMECLMSHDWPGNARELKNILERAFILTEGLEMCPSKLLETHLTPQNEITQDMFLQEKEIAPLKDAEKIHILHAMHMLGGNYTKTARALRISVSTLKRKLKCYGLAGID